MNSSSTEIQGYLNNVKLELCLFTLSALMMLISVVILIIEYSTKRSEVSDASFTYNNNCNNVTISNIEVGTLQTRISDSHKLSEQKGAPELSIPSRESKEPITHSSNQNEEQTIFIETPFNQTPAKPLRNSVTLRALENGSAKLKRNNTMATIASVYDVPRCIVKDTPVTRSCQVEINRIGIDSQDAKAVTDLTSKVGGEDSFPDYSIPVTRTQVPRPMSL